jgi:hypothetical protein
MGTMWSMWNSVVLSIQQVMEARVDCGWEPELSQFVGQIQFDLDNLRHRVLLALNQRLVFILPGRPRA